MSSSVEANLARVREGIKTHDYETRSNHVSESHINHARILQEHEDAIREHERRLEDHRCAMEGHRRKRRRDSDSHKGRERGRDQNERGLRFRFKEKGQRSDSGRRHKKERRNEDRDRSQDRKSERRNGNLESFVAHPFARPSASPPPYLDPTLDPRTRSASTSEAPQDDHDTDAAFRTSLFDALADDEGAATYWEAVYGDPIHVYPRPKVPGGDTSHDDHEPGTLEAMNDDEYADYVKQRMWERKNPHLVREMRLREEKEQQRKKNEHERKTQGARAREGQGLDDAGGDGFMRNVDEALARGAKRKDQKRWKNAWTIYTQKWEELKALQDGSKMLDAAEIAANIPWPVVDEAKMIQKISNAGDEAIHQNEVEAFFSHAPLEEGETLLSRLKAERVRWHPDKIQHRFGGSNVGEETLKLTTKVFLAIDDLLAKERQKQHG